MYKDKGIVTIMGDFNAHLNGRVFIKPLDARGLQLLNFLTENNLVSVNTMDMCIGAESTFVSYDGRHESFIDHIVIGQERLDTVKYCTILDDSVLNVSRHRPIVCDINFPNTNNMDIPLNQDPRINWRKADLINLHMYSECLTHILDSYPFINQRYNDTECIDRVYDTLVQSMFTFK